MAVGYARESGGWSDQEKLLLHVLKNAPEFENFTWSMCGKIFKAVVNQNKDMKERTQDACRLYYNTYKNTKIIESVSKDCEAGGSVLASMKDLALAAARSFNLNQNCSGSTAWTRGENVLAYVISQKLESKSVLLEDVEYLFKYASEEYTDISKRPTFVIKDYLLQHKDAIKKAVEEDNQCGGGVTLIEMTRIVEEAISYINEQVFV